MGVPGIVVAGTMVGVAPVVADAAAAGEGVMGVLVGAVVGVTGV